MKALYVSSDGIQSLEARWREAGVASEYFSSENLLGAIQDKLRIDRLSGDIVVIVCDPTSKPKFGVFLESGLESFGVESARKLIRNFRHLPEDIAMSDGRKWNSVPCILIAYSADIKDDPTLLREGFDGVLYIDESGLAASVELIKDVVRDYRRKILDELDGFGFIVSYEAGRFKLGPALKPKQELSGKFYFGPADTRPKDRFVTVDRDVLGVEIETEKFEHLINQESTTEEDLQIFFEEHPHFIACNESLISKPNFSRSEGKTIIPDFILKPLVAEMRDSRWQILDLKRADVNLLVGKANRRRFSSEVASAIRQLRDYGDYFADPRNGIEVEKRLSHRLKTPRLGVLIGRLNNADIEDLEAEQARNPDVKIVTYDEILQDQRRLIT